MTDKKELTELKPCPFCGGFARVATTCAHWYNVWCMNSECYAQGGMSPIKEDAVEMWNKRD